MTYSGRYLIKDCRWHLLSTHWLSLHLVQFCVDFDSYNSGVLELRSDFEEIHDELLGLVRSTKLSLSFIYVYPNKLCIEIILLFFACNSSWLVKLDLAGILGIFHFKLRLRSYLIVFNLIASFELWIGYFMFIWHIELYVITT